MKVLEKNSAKFLYETGLLYKLNKEVLHPLGLAMSVTVDDSDNVDGFGPIYAAPEGEKFEFSEEVVKEAEAKLAKHIVKDRS